MAQRQKYDALFRFCSEFRTYVAKFSLKDQSSVDALRQEIIFWTSDPGLYQSGHCS